MTEPPKQLGPYTLDREIGRGGMGVVYLGHDTRLDRAVAIKSLPEHLALDPDRLARFEREAKTLASLTHPNVAGIHGIETHEGARYLILEYVEGETLADRLDRGAMHVDETLELIVQIAAGVEAAHEAGIIHRDLKPANIKITPEGQAKVLDFGLAKADDGASSASSSNILTASPTITTPIQHSPTIPGAIMGTAPYMSPEQARGRPVDRRTDIWSFGVILYEMLTGDSPFRGETVSDSIAAILQKDLNLQHLPASVPQQFGRVLERCLSRDKNERYRHIGDVALDLLAADAMAPAATPQRKGVAGWLVAALVLLAAALGIGGAWLALQQDAPPPQVTRFDINLEQEGQIKFGGAPRFAFSPDGRRLYMVQTIEDRDYLYVRDIDALDGTLIAEDRVMYAPFVSPDGQWVAYFTDKSMKKISARGGSPIEIVPVADSSRGGSWGPDNTIIYAPSTIEPLHRVSANGGNGEAVTTLDPANNERSHRWPSFVPGHPNLVVFTNQSSQDQFDNAAIDLLDLDTGEQRRLHTGGSYPKVTPGGTLLYTTNNTLYAGALNENKDGLLGQPIPVVYNIGFSNSNGGAQYCFAHNGSMLYAEVENQDGSFATPRWVSLNGEVSEPVATPGQYSGPRIAADGSGFVYSDNFLPIGRVNIYEFRRGITTPVSPSEHAQFKPIWSPDKKFVAYASPTDESAIPALTIASVDQSEPIRSATPSKLSAQLPYDWSPDGTRILFSNETRATGWDIYEYEVESGQTHAVITTPGRDRDARFSPDGSWISFTSDTTGSREVFIQRADGGDVHRQVSIAGGSEPLWAPDGSAVYFLIEGDTTSRNRLMSAKIDLTVTPPVIDAPEVLTEIDLISGGLRFPRFDIHPDGERFLAIQYTDERLERDYGLFRLTLNWFEELEGDSDN